MGKLEREAYKKVRKQDQEQDDETNWHDHYHPSIREVGQRVELLQGVQLSKLAEMLESNIGREQGPALSLFHDFLWEVEQQTKGFFKELQKENHKLKIDNFILQEMTEEKARETIERLAGENDELRETIENLETEISILEKADINTGAKSEDSPSLKNYRGESVKKKDCKSKHEYDYVDQNGIAACKHCQQTRNFKNITAPFRKKLIDAMHTNWPDHAPYFEQSVNEFLGKI